MVGHQIDPQGISIVTCTKRENYIDNVFNNYTTQVWPKKELIIVLNNDRLDLSYYRKRARRYKNVSVYQLPQKTSLGKCLNFAASKAQFGYISKFDDDDYYAPHYVNEMMRAFARTKADVVGKLTIFLYLQHRKTLLLLFPNKENRFVNRVGGGTITFRKKVFRVVKFPDVTIGEDVGFQRLCRAKGFQIYSTSRYNFTGIRRKNSAGHTWRVSDDALIRFNKFIAKTENYRAYARRRYK